MRKPVPHAPRRGLLLAGLMLAGVLAGGCASVAPPGPDQDGAQPCGAAEGSAGAAIGPSSADAAMSASAPGATAPAPMAQQGQLSIKLQAFGKTPAKGLSLGFFFSGTAQTGPLELITLMGSQVAQVHWTPQEVWLTDDKGQRRYPSMESLSEVVLGEPLPLQALVQWMRGRPDPAWPSAPTDGDRGFTQLGWTIDLTEMDAKKLTATRAGGAGQRGVYIKVYLDR